VTYTNERRPDNVEAAPTTALEANASLPPVAALLHGRAAAYPPVVGRKLWLIVVSRCPWCGAGHAHRSGLTARLLSGRELKICPVWTKPYVLAPVRRGREARRPSAVTG
jgi:hypothetical protein